MRVTGRGCAATRKAWRILISPRRTSSSLPRSGHFCGRWKPERRRWRLAPRLAIFSTNKTGRETMPVTTADKRAAFRKLHDGGCFIIPNPFDPGSAVALQHLGFKALASTSAGFAWTIAKADNRVTVDEVCDHLTAICAAVDIPVNADFEGGFAHEADKVGVNVARGVATGVAGLSIEDSTGDATKPLYERAHAIARIKAARAAIDADNSGVLLTGRCEGLLVGQTDME